jgi:hypothetical protein
VVHLRRRWCRRRCQRVRGRKRERRRTASLTGGWFRRKGSLSAPGGPGSWPGTVQDAIAEGVLALASGGWPFKPRPPSRKRLKGRSPGGWRRHAPCEHIRAAADSPPRTPRGTPTPSSTPSTRVSAPAHPSPHPSAPKRGAINPPAAGSALA